MKKITFMMLGMAAMLAVSCGEKKDAPKEGEAPATEQQDPTAPAATDNPVEEVVNPIGDEAVLNKYIELVDKLAEAQKAKNVEETTKLMKDLTIVAQDVANIDQTKLTKEQVEKLAAVGKKYAEAMMAK